MVQANLSQFVLGCGWIVPGLPVLDIKEPPNGGQHRRYRFGSNRICHGRGVQSLVDYRWNRQIVPVYNGFCVQKAFYAIGVPESDMAGFRLAAWTLPYFR